MIRKILRLLMIFFILPLSVSGGLLWIDHRGVFLIENIDVRFADEIEHSQYFVPQVAQLNLDLRDLRGRKLWQVELKSVMEKTESHPWIESVSIHRSWPSTLVVTLKSKELFANVLNPQGRLQPVLADGDLLPPVDPSQAPDLPLVNDRDFFQSKELRRRLVNLLMQVPKKDGRFNRNSIAELTYHSKQGFAAVLVDSRATVNLGEGDISVKAQRVSQVLEYLENRQIEARVIEADLSKKVLVRPRKAP